MYYVMLVKDNTVCGPYKFKDAMKEKNYWDNFGEKTVILKVIVDVNGKEVK